MIHESESSFEFVIFDNDGVNIDSEHVAMRTANDFFNEVIHLYNKDWDVDSSYIYENFAGVSTDIIARDLIREFSLPVADISRSMKLGTTDLQAVCDELANMVTIETIEKFKTDLQAIPGMPQALRGIKASYKSIALATTSRRDRMDVSLAFAVDPLTGKNAGLAEIFPPGELRRSGYGWPNKYIEFFEHVGWNPARCVVVEDSISGVKKAMDAGLRLNANLRTVGTVASRFYESKAAQAHLLIEAGARLVVSSAHDLPDALRWLEAGLSPTRAPDFRAEVFSASN